METTVVSLLPFQLEERKPTLIPEWFVVPAAKDGKPGILHVKDCHSNLAMIEGKTFPVTHSAEEISNSIVNDYCSSHLEASDDAKPALFWVFGRLSASDVLVQHKDKVDEARKKQNIWFMRLVRRADDDWEKTKQHRMITDLQRHAATSLGLHNKAWMTPIEPMELVKCPFCMHLIEKEAVICTNCKQVVDKEKAAKLGLAKVS